MAVYENDTLVIPQKYKRMSASEIEVEKEKVLRKLVMSERSVKEQKKNKKGIMFKF